MKVPGIEEIRPARPEDAAAISALIAATAEAFITPEFSEEGRRTLLTEMNEEAIAGHLANPAFRYHVAEDAEGRIAGIVSTLENSHLFGLYVAAEHHGRGLARRLWETARDACRAAGASGEFTVKSSRYAVGVYEAFGFVREGDEEEKKGVVFVPMRLRPPLL
jgi:GNAT superfamily N-acetyltransferase